MLSVTYAECHIWALNAECHIYVFMMGGIMPNVIMLSVVTPKANIFPQNYDNILSSIE